MAEDAGAVEAWAGFGRFVDGGADVFLCVGAAIFVKWGNGRFCYVSGGRQSKLTILCIKYSKVNPLSLIHI